MALSNLNGVKALSIIISARHIPQDEYQELYKLTKTRNEYNLNALVYDEGIVLEFTRRALSNKLLSKEFPVVFEVINKVHIRADYGRFYLDLCEYADSVENVKTYVQT